MQFSMSRNTNEILDSTLHHFRMLAFKDALNGVSPLDNGAMHNSQSHPIVTW